MRLLKAVSATVGATGVALVMASNAHALGFQNLSSAPANNDAGANSDFTQHIEFTTPADDVKNLIVHLPPGQVGNPTATPKCTVVQLNSDTCPANTQVGVTTTTADAFLVPGVPVEQVIPGKVYNLDAQPGEPARFGIVLNPDLGDNVVLQAGASLRQSDFGLDTIINGIPNTASGIPVLGTVDIDIKALDLTLFGTVNGGTPDEATFMRNPTSCGEAVTGFEAISYTGSTATTPATGSASFTPDECAALDFSPELTATVSGADALDNMELSTVISQEETEAGLKRAEVFLPVEANPNNPILTNACPVANFNADTCNPISIVGSARAESPLLDEELAGNVHLINLGGLTGIGLDLEGPLSMKLTGQFVFSPELATGNLFEGLPDIPISEFELTIDGSEGGLLIAERDLCDPPPLELDYTFNGHNGEETTGSENATVENCAPPSPPTATVKTKNLGGPKPKVTVEVTAGSEEIQSVRVKVPKRLRFASGDEFTDGTSVRDQDGQLDDDVMELLSGRTVNTDFPNTQVTYMKLRSGGGALIPTGKGGPKTFKIKVTDEEGTVTKLTG